ncbi:MAG: ABC transporter permease [Burkholderiales bacterium]|nr:ABC transporter permease [Burkholderiales bacterium]
MSIFPIARITLLEAARSRLPWLIGLVLLASLAVAGFLQQVALIEVREVQGAIIAALLRACAVFFVVLFVVTSMVREANDKFLELALSQPLPRAGYLLGKFLGFAAVAGVTAVALGLPLLLFASAARVSAWTLSLFGELLIMAAVSLFCVLTLSHVVAALSAVAGFYLLARSIAALQIIARPSEENIALGPRIADWIAHGIALAMPRLDRMTQSAWLTDSGSVVVHDLTSAAAQTAIYVALILAAALFDLYRQEI